jgi:uncharacterized protein YndB with AHSA1/START domain
MDGTLETIDGRPALRFERRYAHSVERLWRAVTDPAELERWFPAHVDWGPELGETFESHGVAGGITELDEPHTIAWSWGDELFRFELRADGDGCRLVFTHVLDDRALAAQHAAGWDTYFDRLEAHVAGGHLSEERAHDPAAERHERYAERFGLEPTPGRRMFATLEGQRLTLEDGPVLRLERHYRHPVERVWRALTDPDEVRHWFPSEDEPLEVSEEVPPRLLAGTWYGDELRFELRPDGDGCILVFTHAFTDRDTAARTAAGWDRCFARMDALFAGHPMSEPDSLELWPEIHERYAETFGVDPEVGRRAIAERLRT